MSLSTVLHDKRKEIGLTLAEIADKVGVSEATVQRWESGNIKNIRHERIARLADVLQVSPAFLMGWDDAQHAEQPRRAVRIPVLGRVQAGIPIEAVEEILDYEEITPEMASTGDHFALRIRGASMEPKFSDGDVIIVRKQPDADTGDIAVVLVNGDEATVKKIKKSPSGIALLPTNPAFEPMFYSPQEIEALPVTIIGKVVELRAKF